VAGHQGTGLFIGHRHAHFLGHQVEALLGQESGIGQGDEVAIQLRRRDGGADLAGGVIDLLAIDAVQGIGKFGGIAFRRAGNAEISEPAAQAFTAILMGPSALPWMNWST
jgi:hypothetical protein